MERALAMLASDQVPFAAARALNDMARGARDRVNAEMGDIFDRPTMFTRRSVVAPKELSAQKDRLAAVVTVRPVQAKYLLLEETGGTRTPADNTRRPGAQAIVLPGRTLLEDDHGNVPAGALRRLRRDARSAKRGGATARDNSVVFLAADARGNKAGIGGYFRRVAGGLQRLTAFKASTSYQPRLRFHDHVAKSVAPRWTEAFVRRLYEAIATAR